MRRDGPLECDGNGKGDGKLTNTVLRWVDKKKLDVRKVAAREIFNLDKLRKVYSEPDATGEAVLRVFHVQNAPWATLFLLRKFNIYNKDDIVGTDFGRYVKHKRPERRGGKPFLSGKTWKVRHDPWRGISATSFGLDYLKHYKVLDPVDRTGLDANDTEKMMELNCYNEDGRVLILWVNGIADVDYVLMQIIPLMGMMSLSRG